MPAARVVLGIDAAWTPTGPSGVALATLSGNEAKLIASAPSYSAFCNVHRPSDVDWRDCRGAPFEARRVLDAVASLAGHAPNLIAIDMPVSTKPIAARRAADNLVSRAFGAAGAGTHSPSSSRPGEYGRSLQASLEAHGFSLQTEQHRSANRQLIEVYPHAALIRLAGAKQRLPYKEGKRWKYWPDASPAERVERLQSTWVEIARLLEGGLPGARQAISSAREFCSSLKAVEDVIDAIVCAWVGVCYVRGDVECFGDADAAIWTPSAAFVQRPRIS